MRLVTVFRAHGHPGRHNKTTATTWDAYYTTRVFTSAIYECDEYYVVWKNRTEEGKKIICKSSDYVSPNNSFHTILYNNHRELRVSVNCSLCVSVSVKEN